MKEEGAAKREHRTYIIYIYIEVLTPDKVDPGCAEDTTHRNENAKTLVFLPTDHGSLVLQGEPAIDGIKHLHCRGNSPPLPFPRDAHANISHATTVNLCQYTPFAKQNSDFFLSFGKCESD